MVDYSFVKFLNKDLNAEGVDSEGKGKITDEVSASRYGKMILGATELMTKKDPVELARAVLAAFDEQIAAMHNEAAELEIKTDNDFNQGVEMRGQGKTLKKKIVEAAERFSKPLYQEYKSVKNLETSITGPLDDMDTTLKKKTDDFAYLKLLAERKREQEAREQAAALQAKIDAEQRAQAERELKAAKKEKREAIIPDRIVVDVPVVPQKVAAKTEHGSVNVKMVLKGEITDLESDFVFKLVLAQTLAGYKTLAEAALKKAISAGAVGLAGGPGVEVREVADTQHRRR